jgi:hypothetical protein
VSNNTFTHQYQGIDKIVEGLLITFYKAKGLVVTECYLLGRDVGSIFISILEDNLVKAADHTGTAMHHLAICGLGLGSMVSGLPSAISFAPHLQLSYELVGGAIFLAGAVELGAATLDYGND